MIEHRKVLLIGGTSHLGKSTFAKRLASQLGWKYLSTDQLARHPGRPWREDGSPLPVDVVAHYTELSTDALADSVLQHYRQNVWPIADALIRSHLHNPYDPCLVFEGSAILPDEVRAAAFDGVGAVWLTAPEDLIANRIRQSSGYEGRSSAEKQLIDAFLRRSLYINRALTHSVSANGQKSLDAGSAEAFAELAAMR
ncbi:MAG: hypothetical protein ACR2PZ_16220 [Pseudomonadales bacterium]